MAIRLAAIAGAIAVTTGLMHAANPAPKLELPAFPMPNLVQQGGQPLEVGSIRVLRELHRGGVHGEGNLETVDADYALIRQDSMGLLSAWLEGACHSVGYDLAQARGQVYDGAVLARLLRVATGLAGLQNGARELSMPIGTLVCARRTAWGDLPADGATDAYVAVMTDAGILVYDPPSRQLVNLADFPNREQIVRVRF